MSLTTWDVLGLGGVLMLCVVFLLARALEWKRDVWENEAYRLTDQVVALRENIEQDFLKVQALADDIKQQSTEADTL